MCAGLSHLSQGAVWLVKVLLLHMSSTCYPWRKPWISNCLPPPKVVRVGLSHSAITLNREGVLLGLVPACLCRVGTSEMHHAVLSMCVSSCGWQLRVLVWGLRFLPCLFFFAPHTSTAMPAKDELAIIRMLLHFGDFWDLTLSSSFSQVTASLRSYSSSLCFSGTCLPPAWHPLSSWAWSGSEEAVCFAGLHAPGWTMQWGA